MVSDNRSQLVHAVDENGNIDGEDLYTRGAIFRKNLDKTFPFVEMFYFNKKGKILLPKRGQKLLYPNTRLPFSAGGLVTIRDVQYHEESDNTIDYRKGVTRESNEELRPELKFREDDFIPLEALTQVIDIREAAENPKVPPIHLRVFRLDEISEYGPLHPHKGEILTRDQKIKGKDWYTPDRLRRNGIHRKMGIYGEKVLEEIASISNEIKTENPPGIKRFFGYMFGKDGKAASVF